MKTDEPHWIKDAVLAGLVLLCCGIIAILYINKGVSPRHNRITARGSYGVGRQSVEVPVFSFLPSRFLSRTAVSILRERNAGVLESVFKVFDPSLRSFLRSVPIVLDPSADTAKAYLKRGYIGVSPDWDNNVLKSRYKEIYEQRGMKPEDPVFTHVFKKDLLIHEFLHILQIRRGVDIHSFYEALTRWYADPQYGIPSPSGMFHAGTLNGRRPLSINRTKYILWHELYNYRRLSDMPGDGSWKNMRYGQRYRRAEKGVEEFAYLGQEILSTGNSFENFEKTGQWSDKDWKLKKMRLLEVSPEIIAFYRGVFNPDLMQ